MSVSAVLDQHKLTEATLCEALGVSRETVRLWRNGKRHISSPRVLEIEKRFGIPRHELRPDVYPPAPANTGRAA